MEKGVTVAEGGFGDIVGIFWQVEILRGNRVLFEVSYHLHRGRCV